MESGSGAVARELERLEQSGLILASKVGNQKHYRVNRDAPIFQEVRSIVRKTMGVRDPLKSSLSSFSDRIRTAFVYGSVAKGQDKARSDIALMVIADDLTYSDVFAGLQKAEAVLGRPINPTIMDAAAWKKRKKNKSSFITSVSESPKIFIFGSEEDLNLER